MQVSDLVERLRDREAVVLSGLFHAIPAMNAAANEIERLRAQVETAKAYVDRAIASYQGDPADNYFHRGYLAALEVVRAEAFSPFPSTNRQDGK